MPSSWPQSAAHLKAAQATLQRCFCSAMAPLMIITTHGFVPEPCGR
jgi:hypothetical protein